MSLKTDFVSRVGKSSVYKIHILKEKDKILSRDSKRFHPEKQTKDKPRPVENYEEVLNQIPMPKNPKKTLKPKPSFVFRSVSREKYYKPYLDSNSSPPAGHYNVAFPSKPKLIPNFSTKKTLKRDPVKPQPKIKSRPQSSRTAKNTTFPDFKKQLKRPSFAEANSQVSELYNTSFRTKVRAPNISKQLARTELFSHKEFSPQYNPNKDFLLKKLCTTLSFGKMLGREKPQKTNSCSNLPNYAKPRKKTSVLKAR